MLVRTTQSGGYGSRKGALFWLALAKEMLMKQLRVEYMCQMQALNASVKCECQMRVSHEGVERKFRMQA